MEPDGGLDVIGVRAGVGLGQCIRRQFATGRQIGQETGLLFVRAEQVDALVADRPRRQADDEKVESLYLSFLSRKPTMTERGIARTALEAGLATTDLAWTLLNTREFLFLQ